jgi:hypothetical protein
MSLFFSSFQQKYEMSKLNVLEIIGWFDEQLCTYLQIMYLYITSKNARALHRGKQIMKTKKTSIAAPPTCNTGDR